MSAVIAFIGMFLLSLFVAMLAALQLADYFGATEEFILILIVLPVFVAVCMLVLIVTNLVAQRARLFSWVAALLVLLAFAPIAVPALLLRSGGHTANPLAGMESVAITLELVVPALLAVLVQWGLVRRRWLRLQGEEDLTRWPWITTVVAGFAILNPYGLQVAGQALGHRPTSWLRDHIGTVAVSAVAAVIAIALIEYYIRSRIVRRRLAQTFAVGKVS